MAKNLKSNMAAAAILIFAESRLGFLVNYEPCNVYPRNKFQANNYLHW